MNNITADSRSRDSAVMLSISIVHIPVGYNGRATDKPHFKRFFVFFCYVTKRVEPSIAVQALLRTGIHIILRLRREHFRVNSVGELRKLFVGAVLLDGILREHRDLIAELAARQAV